MAKAKIGRPRVLKSPVAINLRVEARDARALRGLAEELGTSPSHLLRTWLRQGLERARRRKAKE